MTKLLEGYYKGIDHFYKYLKNEGGDCTASDGGGNDYPVRIEYGDFGEADPRIQEKTGIKNYNIKLFLMFSKRDETEGSDQSEEKGFEFIDLGVLYEQGRKCVSKGAAGISGLEKITEEELEEILNDFDPIEAPPGPYKIQPENQGKTIWFTGAPGMGKSTSAQLLARKFGYVYYEADCFGTTKNPYVPLDDDNPSLAQIRQKTLRGPGEEERQSLIKRTKNLWDDLMHGRDYDKELMIEYHDELAKDVAREKKRIGGDFAVASVLISADVRAHMRKILGPQLVIVCLTMPQADKRERVLKRHDGDVTSADMMDFFETLMEPVQADEPNTFEVKVTGSMTREDVVEEVRKIIT